MKRWFVVAALAPLCFVSCTGSAQPVANQYRDVASRIIARATKDSAAWNRLAVLTETFGNRFSGSESLERALDRVLAGRVDFPAPDDPADAGVRR
jgi:carboxypeptidase Q